MKRKPSEFAVNSFASMMSVLQYDDLDMISSQNIFNEDYPCHIYMICRRPRVIIVPEMFQSVDDSLSLTFNIQKKDGFEKREVKVNNPFGTDQALIETKYPYNTFVLKCKGDEIIIKSASLLQNFPRHHFEGDFLDLEVLYIGQSYGIDGARTAPDRLKKHETLQAIYAEALQKNPDQEIWLLLLSFEQIGISMFDGRTKFSEDEIEKDKPRAFEFFKAFSNGGITEQQFINFTEAALIRYFRPPFNKEYKDTFPSPAHKTYKECYDLDINSVCFELGTIDSINIMIYSDQIEKCPIHFGNFLLHSKEERVSMFDFSNFY